MFEDSVTAAVNNLLANNILPHACRAVSDPKVHNRRLRLLSESVAQSDDIYVPQVLDLFALNQESLQKMFCFYKRVRKWEDVVQVRNIRCPNPCSNPVILPEQWGNRSRRNGLLSARL